MRLHTADSTAIVYCQSPLIRTTETANGAGSTLDDFRSAIATAVSSRTGWCRFVNGKTILPISQISNSSQGGGVHPTTTGHLMMAEYAAGVLDGGAFSGGGGGGGGTAVYLPIGCSFIRGV